MTALSPPPRAFAGPGTRTITVGGMNAARLPRGTRVDPVKFGYVIDRSYKDRFEGLARRAGVSGAVYLERVLEHLETELTDRGLPQWWPETELTDGELDMPST